MQTVGFRFLDALRKENRGRPPVWLMRQAGRYLPEYRALREKHSLRELFLTPELAAQITLMPIERFGVDAAILFSDITIVALALGLELDFLEGPQVNPRVTPDRVENLAANWSALSPVWNAVKLLKNQLTVPLIGFCGGPFTVASYLVEGGLEGIKKWAYRYPEKLDLLLEKIATISIGYLQKQVEMGANAIQIFDSWANVLSSEHFLRFCLPFYKRLIDEVDAPSILFLRSAALYLDDLKNLPCALSIDWQTSLSLVRQKTRQALQGNLDPDLLYAPLRQVRQETKKLLESMKADPGFILGLGHGVKPDVPVEAVQELVATVQTFGV